MALSRTGLAAACWLLVAWLAPGQPALRELYRWKQVDLLYPSRAARAAAEASGELVPGNNLPLGLEVWRDRVFVTLPRWKPGVPATLAYVPRSGEGPSPLLRAWPDWDSQNSSDCRGLTSVFRVAADPCGRLWVLDSGLVDIATGSPEQRCPPQLLVFDLDDDSLVHRYELPADQVLDGSLFATLAVDVRGGRCDDAHAYLADVARYGLVVYRLRDDTSWRVSHPFFYPDPASCRFELHGVVFRWTDGVFGLSLSPEKAPDGDRTLYFHPMSGDKEYAVPTSVLRNRTAAEDDAGADAFVRLGEPRYPSRAQASASAMDRRGVMFYNLVTRDAVGCWNSGQPRGHVPDLQGVAAADAETLRFPNDLKVDQEERQSVWVLSDRLPGYLYGRLDPGDFNFRVLTGFADELTRGTVCDPDHVDAGPPDVGNRLGCPA
ncbi:protein yellow-like [Bacillus rossius redtenbacheri]|uniref:protein yellow-like n=1 Tax=Bacillus rossius redtenbacheri TaxID=93214 RepID=UPI002FDEB869